MRTDSHHKQAFSLVELSIVLVILGLLTGGVLTGQSLIRAAELRSVTTEYSNYQTAVMTFRDKYFQIPGDITNAEDFWGSMSTGVCPNATAGAGTETCNGNGDGMIEIVGSYPLERFTFWQHLANAGLIEGSHTGLPGSGGSGHNVAGENVPTGKISGSCWSIVGLSASLSGDIMYFDGNYGNVFQYGLEHATGYCGGAASSSALNAEELWNIEQKADDGSPAYGRFRAYKNLTHPDCATTGVSATAVYDVSNTTKGCVLVAITGF